MMNTNQQKILFLNLPNPVRVQRRYMCSYNAPSMLFPPIEMLYLAAIAREWFEADVSLIDAIAEGITLKETKEKIAAEDPEMLVVLTGFEIFEEDIDCIRHLKEAFPDKLMVLFGHYATLFPDETFEGTGADYILEGEPDINFANLLTYLKGEISLEEMKGVFHRNTDATIAFDPGAGRIKRPNDLPLPAHDLLKIEHYHEPFLPRPFALIQSARGCPYSCNYCVRSFGKRLSLRSPESIIEEMKLLKQLHRVKSVRFIDDTFTATSKRIIRLCELMIEEKIDLEWTCLSRPDTLNEEMISWMEKAGCKRVYIGIESGSEKILGLLNKQIDLGESLENIRMLKRHNIETSAFFMVGHPEETEADFEASVQFAKKANFDYIMAFEYTVYPGTSAFDEYADIIDFSLLPYRNEFKDPAIPREAQRKVKEFYKRYYINPNFIGKSMKRLISHPAEMFANATKLLKYQIRTPFRSTTRRDYV